MYIMYYYTLYYIHCIITCYITMGAKARRDFLEHTRAYGRQGAGRLRDLYGIKMLYTI